MGTRPNSAEHVRRAIEAGAAAVELDIRLSADGRVVLSHDPDAALPAGGRRALREMAWEEISSLPRGGERALDLDGAFGLLSGASAAVNLDAKEAEAAVAAAALASRRGLAESVLFSGLEPEVARALRGELRGYPRLLNADPILPASGYGLESMREALRIARECGCCGLNLDFRAATEELSRFIQPRCLPLFLWTADEPAEMERALRLGPYSITTNRPDILLRMLEV
jgi:glycerophosphoryl diester phosphodiesterase